MAALLEAPLRMASDKCASWATRGTGAAGAAAAAAAAAAMAAMAVAAPAAGWAARAAGGCGWAGWAAMGAGVAESRQCIATTGPREHVVRCADREVGKGEGRVR